MEHRDEQRLMAGMQIVDDSGEMVVLGFADVPGLTVRAPRRALEGRADVWAMWVRPQVERYLNAAAYRAHVGA